MALKWAACRWTLGHSSMCHTFSLWWPHVKHRWSILLLIWAWWCMVGVHSWAYFEIWSCWPGARALNDEPFACQSTDSKVSSVHSASIVGSRFLESLMMVSCRVVAVAAVVTWWSCFFVTSQPWYRSETCVEVWLASTPEIGLLGCLSRHYWCIRSHILLA
jgi:hypothetical protein